MNQSGTAGAGIEWDLFERRETSIVTGLAFMGQGYGKNLSRFSLGHGGYFSPQLLVHAGLPLRWTRKGDTNWEVVAEPAVNWFRERAVARFPADGALQTASGGEMWPARTSLGVALDVRSRLSLPITERVEARLELEVHRAEAYQEVRGGAVLRYAFPDE